MYSARVRLIGFSLMELMIVMAIIGILTIISIPTYQKYIQRARFTEVIMMTESFKMAVALALQEGYPIAELQNNMHDIPPEPVPTANLASLTVRNGIITATASKLSGEATYILRPNEDGSLWSIEGTCLTLGLCHG